MDICCVKHVVVKAAMKSVLRREPLNPDLVSPQRQMSMLLSLTLSSPEDEGGYTSFSATQVCDVTRYKPTTDDTTHYFQKHTDWKFFKKRTRRKEGKY